MIGKLKRSLKERCPECGKVLQIRVIEVPTLRNGEQIYVSREYIKCSNCEYERPTEQKRIRRQEEI